MHMRVVCARRMASEAHMCTYIRPSCAMDAVLKSPNFRPGEVVVVVLGCEGGGLMVD
jgi:hypothetical protein